jgi:hypothetical protein
MSPTKSTPLSGGACLLSLLLLASGAVVEALDWDVQTQTFFIGPIPMGPGSIRNDMYNDLEFPR